MDIVLKRYSPPTKQPALRGRAHTSAATEPSTRPGEAALEPDASPHGMAHDGESSHQAKEPQAQDLPFSSGDAPGTHTKQRAPTGEPKQVSMNNTRDGADAMHPEEQQQQVGSPGRGAPDSNEGPLASRLTDDPGFHWLRRHLGRLQHELLLQQQQQQQRVRNGPGGEHGNGFRADIPMADAQAPPPDASVPATKQQQQQQRRQGAADPQDLGRGRGGSGAGDKQAGPVTTAAPLGTQAPAGPERRVDSPQTRAGTTQRPQPPPSAAYQDQQAQYPKQVLLKVVRAVRTPTSQSDARRAVGKDQLPQLAQQLAAADQQGGSDTAGRAAGGATSTGPGGGAAGSGRSRSAGRERAGERAQGGANANGGARSGRPSTEDELFLAAGALELLMNSGPSAAAGGAGGASASGPRGPQGGAAAGSGPAGPSSAVVRVASTGRAAAGGAAARGEPAASGRVMGGRGGIGPGGDVSAAGGGGASGRRGGAGRGTRAGGTGPRIIRGSMPEPDLDDDDDPTRSYGNLGARGGPSRLSMADSPNRGRPMAAPGGGRYGPAENDGGGGSDLDGEPGSRGRRNGMYRGGLVRGDLGPHGDLYDDMPDDEVFFGPVPRRPRTSVYCAPLMYEEILAADSPYQTVKVLALTVAQLGRMVERQRESQQHLQQLQVRRAGLGGLHGPVQVLQRPPQPLHLDQRPPPPHHTQHLQPPMRLIHTGLTLAPGSYNANTQSQDLLRRAILIQQQQHMQQQQGISLGDWDVAPPLPRGDLGHGVGGPALALARRPGPVDIFGAPRPPRQATGPALGPSGDWPGEPNVLQSHETVDDMEPMGEMPLPRPLYSPSLPYSRSYEEASAAAGMAAMQHRHQHQPLGGSSYLRLGSYGRGGGGGGGAPPVGGAGLQLGGDEEVVPADVGDGLGRSGGGGGMGGPQPPLAALHPAPSPQQPSQRDPREELQEGPAVDAPGEAPSGPKRRGRPPKVRHQASDMQQQQQHPQQQQQIQQQLPTGSGSQLDEGAAGPGVGAKRPWSPLDGPGAAQGPYGSGGGGRAGPPPQYSYDGAAGMPLDLADEPAVDQAQEGMQWMRRGPRDDGVDTVVSGGRTPGARFTGDGAAAGAGGVVGAPRPRGSGSFVQGRPSLSTVLDSDVEEAQPPPSARAALVAAAAAAAVGWRGSGRGGAAAAGQYSGRQSWQDRSIDNGEDMDSAPFGAHGDAGGGPDLYYNRSYDRPEPAAAGAAGPPKRQRLADGAGPVNGRSGSAGGRGRGRHTGLSVGSASGGPGSVALPPRTGGVAAALAQRQQLQLSYEPLIEVKDVQEEDSGRKLSLTFLHSTLGTFAGSLALLAAE